MECSKTGAECTSGLGVFTTHNGSGVCATAASIHGSARVGDEIEYAVLAGAASRAGLELLADGFQRIRTTHNGVANFGVGHGFADADVHGQSPIQLRDAIDNHSQHQQNSSRFAAAQGEFSVNFIFGLTPEQ